MVEEKRTLERIPAGQKVFIDTNIFHLYFRGPKEIKEQCYEFIERIRVGEIAGYTSTMVLDEFIYKMLLKLIEVDHRKNPLEIIRQDKQKVVKKYSSIVEQFLLKILSIENLIIIPIEMQDIISAMSVMKTYGLLPRDAINVALMQRYQIKIIASCDHDYDVVTTIERYYPEIKK